MENIQKLFFEHIATSHPCGMHNPHSRSNIVRCVVVYNDEQIGFAEYNTKLDMWDIKDSLGYTINEISHFMDARLLRIVDRSAGGML